MDEKNNVLIPMDFPDPDVIRVGDTYYMISTTMHFMPGGVILRSYDLRKWEIITYVYDCLEDSPRHRLEGSKNIYGEGMWAASLCYHNKKYYVCFTANDTRKTYIYTAESIYGPWSKTNIEGFYHDNSILFDEDGKVYVFYGNKDIYVTELDSELKGPKPGGLHKKIISDIAEVQLGYEGTHVYKIHGKYYVFLIHWPSTGKARRTQACYVADKLTEQFIGKDIFNEDLGYCNQGIAQGGIVDTPEGEWYTVLFQDRGAVGRIPIIFPIHWENDFPIIDSKKQISIKSSHPDHVYEPLVTNDFFEYTDITKEQVCIKKQWQWNHNPVNECWLMKKAMSCLLIKTDKISRNITQANNCLTQRMTYPYCEVEVSVDASQINEGDYTGLCALQSKYSLIALTKENDGYYLVHMKKSGPISTMGDFYDNQLGEITEKIAVDQYQVRLKIIGDFSNMKDIVSCFYHKDDSWIQLGEEVQHQFTLDHFVGCRVGMFIFSTQKTGGESTFEAFKYIDEVR
jgi:beta-xylosidase